MTKIYLDNNATTAIHPEVASMMHECYLTSVGNPASSHHAGRQARRIVEDARDEIAALLGAECLGMQADRLIFTSGGTESNNLAIRGLRGPQGSCIAISAIEHPSVSGPAEALRENGYPLVTLRVQPNGTVDLNQLPALLGGQTSLVSVMLGNNETGVIQPIACVADYCQAHDILIHSDAIQAVGKMEVGFRDLCLDAMSVSAHKFHGPAGIGGLLVRHSVQLDPIFHGGFQQSGLRPGTEPVALVVGFQVALRIALKNLAENRALMMRRRDRLATDLRAAIPNSRVNGEEASRLPHTLNIAFPGVDRQALIMALDLAGVECSTGSACASGSSEPSHTLKAMGASEEVLASSIRFSISVFTTDSEIAEASDRIIRVIKDLQRSHRVVKNPLPPPPGVAKIV